MQIKSTRERLLATTVFCGAAMAVAAPAFAQDASAPPQEVVVTGSRIPQPNLTSTSPLTVVNSQELKLQGTTNVESLLNNLPQVVATQTSQVSNGSNGTATVDLRNLGPTRTLVLVDGKRLAPGDPGSAGAADLNDIPSALVDRIDVVTGGASSVYGSDAVAGVVNFILKKNFQGLRIDAQGGFYNHQNGNDQAEGFLNSSTLLTPVPKPGDVTADGFTYDVTAIIGANLPDDRGNVTAYASYRHLDPVLQGSRDFSACAVGSSIASATSNYANHACFGSSNSAYGRFDNTGTPNQYTGRGTTTVADNPNGTKTFVPYSNALQYNFNPANFLQREDTTYHAGYFARYDLTSKVEVYSDFMFTDDETNAQIAPSGFFSNSGPNLATGYTFNCNNPLLSATQAAQFCPGAVITPGAAGGSTVTTSIRYRFASVPRNTDFRHTSYKFDIGARGDFAEGWHYDAYLQYGTVITNNLTTGYASETNLQNALNVVTVNGVNRCVTNDPKCAPLDIFSSLGRNFTPAALSYVLAPGQETGQATEQIAAANITGDLGRYGVKSPYSDESVGVAFGTEYRRENIRDDFDAELQSGDLSGTGGPAGNVAGTFDVYELYGEARVPLISNKPLIKDLSIDVAYRFSDYSSVGKTDTYKGEANYTPIDSVRFRFSYNRAVRAPSALELFAPTLTGLAGYTDPCAIAVTKPGTFPAAASRAQCAATGLNPALYGILTQCAASQCDIQTAGNPNLKPEIADTYSIGAVFTPTFLRNFSASLDYFNINIQNVIDTGASAPTILSNCISSVDPNTGAVVNAGLNGFCSLIHRDAQGSINSAQGYVVQANVNSGSLQTRGVDFTANYRTRFADWGVPYISQVPGSLAFALVGTYTEDLTFQPLPGLGHYDCVGLFGPECGVPQPHWRGEFRTTWQTPWDGLALSLNWRYIGGVKLDYNSTQPLLDQVGTGIGTLDSAESHIGDYNYFDLAATWRLKDRYTFRAGINNIFDKDPPIIDSNYLGISGPPFGNGNTYPGVYDSLGREVFVGVTADF